MSVSIFITNKKPFYKHRTEIRVVELYRVSKKNGNRNTDTNEWKYWKIKTSTTEIFTVEKSKGGQTRRMKKIMDVINKFTGLYFRTKIWSFIKTKLKNEFLPKSKIMNVNSYFSFTVNHFKITLGERCFIFFTQLQKKFMKHTITAGPSEALRNKRSEE